MTDIDEDVVIIGPLPSNTKKVGKGSVYINAPENGLTIGSSVQAGPRSIIIGAPENGIAIGNNTQAGPKSIAIGPRTRTGSEPKPKKEYTSRIMEYIGGITNITTLVSFIKKLIG